MKVQRSRTYLEIRVSRAYCVEVVLHLRRKDLDWFNNDSETDHWKEFMFLLETSVIPRIFSDELEERSSRVKIPPLGPGGVPIAETNDKNAKPPGKRKGRRKRKAPEIEQEKEDTTKDKEFYHSFGENIQLTYRTDDIKRGSVTMNLTLNEVDGKVMDHYQQLHKLSKRITIWCFPYDPSKPNEPDPSDGGFPRLDMIPISEIFREPKAKN